MFDYDIAYLIGEAAMTSAVAVALYALNRKMKLSEKLHPAWWQLLVGILFGLLAIFGTEFGVPINGAVMNVRDAAPLCAGLFFGAPAGIIAGLIGGIERWYAVLWGAGEFTRVACTVGTICAGLMAAFVRKVITEDRIPGWIYSFAIAGVTEVFHLLMVFLTNIDTLETAIDVTKKCTPVMIPGVMASVGIAALVISRIGSDGEMHLKGKHTIIQDVQAWLLIAVVITFAVTNAFVIVLQTHLCKATATNAIVQTLEDISTDMDNSGLEGDDLKAFVAEEVENWHIGTTGHLLVIDANENRIFASTPDIMKIEADRDVTQEVEELRAEPERVCEIIERNGHIYYYAYIIHDDFYIIGVYPMTEAELGKSVSVYITAFMEIIILAVMFLQIYFLIKMYVVKNLRIINRDLSRIAHGKLDTVVDVRKNEEFSSLSDDINTTVETLKRYIAEANARIDAELSMGKDIQYSALPRVFPESKRFDLYANMLAAKEVGGDFYDFYPASVNEVVFLVADVSGKGIPASLFMMRAKTLIKGLVASRLSPGEVLTRANDDLCLNNEAGMFVTAWLGFLNIDTGEVRYANAGHNPPVLCRANESGNTVEYLRSKPGFILGGMEGIQYKDFSLTLNDGDAIFLYTDGVTEANNAEGELFGEDRLIEALDKVKAVNMRYLCKYIKDVLDHFVGDAPQFDDITMLAIKKKGKGDNDGFYEVTPDKNSIAEVEAYFEKFCEENELPMKLSTKLMVILDEIYSNIVNYSGATKAKILAHKQDEWVILSFEDNGVHYDPLAKEDPDVTLSAEDRNIGGLGIFMVKEMAEDVKYGRINGNNVLDVVIHI